jgi:hypothetical protein
MNVEGDKLKIERGTSEMETMKLQIKAIINHAARQAERKQAEGDAAKARQYEDFGVALLNILDTTEGREKKNV